MFLNVYSGKRVLVTGHTGFKGSWLSHWLLQLGAKVAGYSINTPTTPSNFEVIGLKKQIKHYEGDIRNRDYLMKVFNEFKPEIVFHLAAQALVRRSYEDPVTTFEVNTLGTMNILECIRKTPSVRAGIIITSDKCYRNVEWVWGYRENDMLGGEDPYSGSKGCAELVSYSYIHSYFKNQPDQSVATTRAGNVIGGGDWAEDRIVPDCIRAWSKGEKLVIRNPYATRPWQHVLEPLSGYLWIGANLWERNPKVIGNAYNFGPDATVNHPVETLISMMSQYWPKAKWEIDPEALKNRPEAKLLKLCCDKALFDLVWHAVLPFSETVRFTSEWYQKYYENSKMDMYHFSVKQIEQYCQQAREKELIWSKK